jgi:hypothetical protein
MTNLVSDLDRALDDNEEVADIQPLPPMELAGLEPATSWVRSRRSPN